MNCIRVKRHDKLVTQTYIIQLILKIFKKHTFNFHFFKKFILIINNL